MIGQRAQTAPCREGFAWHSRGDYRVRTAARRRCCKDTDFSYKTKRTRLIYTPLLRVKAAPDGAHLSTDFPTAAPPVEGFLRHHTTKLGRLQKNLLRFSENLPRFSENLLRFSENLLRFFRLYAAIFFLSLPQLKIND